MSGYRRVREALHPVGRYVVAPAARIARRTVQRSVRGAVRRTVILKSGLSAYEDELNRTRRRMARRAAKEELEKTEARSMEKAGDFRTMSAAPVTVGMTIKRPPLASRESGTYDSKIVSASEVLFASVTSTSNSYAGGNPAQEMTLNPLYPSLKILADEAKNFQMFRFTKASVVFESTTNSATSGSIVLGQLTDVIDDAPATYDDAALLKDMIQANVWQSVTLPLDLDKEFRYITSSVAPTPAEVRQINQAKIFYGLVNCPNGTLVGNIKLEYTVELCKRINGTELTSFDQTGYLIPAATALASLGQSVTGAKISPWFQKDLVNQRLIIKPKATYVVNFTLISDADESVVSPGQSIRAYDADDNPIPPVNTWEYAAYAPKTNANQNVYVTMYTFRTPALSSYLDFSGIIGLTGPLDINFSIDILT